MDNPYDVKELIPEFFYFPEFLENQNRKKQEIKNWTKQVPMENPENIFQDIFVMTSRLFKVHSVCVLFSDKA